MWLELSPSMALAVRLRPSGRSSPSTPGSDLLEVCGSGVASELSAAAAGASPGGSPPGIRAPPARRPRQSAMRTLQLALLPAVMLFLAATSLQHRHQQRSQLAEELLRASAAASARGARHLGQTPAVAAGRACAEALNMPQVGVPASAMHACLACLSACLAACPAACLLGMLPLYCVLVFQPAPLAHFAVCRTPCMAVPVTDLRYSPAPAHRLPCCF